MQHSQEVGEAEARIAIDTCVTELHRRGKPGAVAVADSHGELIAFWRTDGCPLPSIVIAHNKPYTAARSASLWATWAARRSKIGRACTIMAMHAMSAGTAGLPSYMEAVPGRGRDKRPFGRG